MSQTENSAKPKGEFFMMTAITTLLKNERGDAHEEIKKQNDFSSSDYKMITAHQKRNLFEKILLCIGIGAKTNIGYGQLKKL